MLTTNDKTKQPDQRGQSLVEFAFSIVVLLILLAGIVDGARALFTYMALRDAAQEGALYGSTNPLDTGGITARVELSSSMVDDMATGGDITIAINYVDANGDSSVHCLGDGITITVTYPQFPITMPFIGTFVGRQWVPISASITDTILRPPCP